MFADECMGQLAGRAAFGLQERWVTVGQTSLGVPLTVTKLFFDEQGEAVVRFGSSSHTSGATKI